MQKPVPLCPECHSEATSEVSTNFFDWMDADGALVAHHEYDSYGNETTGNPPASFGFSTKPLDSTLGLYYYGYRFYSPQWGSWINRDPIGEEGGENLYGFIMNTPVKNTDFLGLSYGPPPPLPPPWLGWPDPPPRNPLPGFPSPLPSPPSPITYPCEPGDSCTACCAGFAAVDSTRCFLTFIIRAKKCGALTNPWAIAGCVAGAKALEGLCLNGVKNRTEACLKNCENCNK